MFILYLPTDTGVYLFPRSVVPCVIRWGAAEGLADISTGVQISLHREVPQSHITTNTCTCIINLKKPPHSVSSVRLVIKMSQVRILCVA